MLEFEAALTNLENLREKDYAKGLDDRNEAATRLQLVDSLLFDCLGWDRWESSPEDRLEGTYADYKLGSPIPLAIWEAKRVGVSFSLPSGSTKRLWKLPILCKEQPALESALRQVRSYCQDRGVATAVVTNGYQVVAFLASRSDGVAPLEGLALVFTSLDDILENFKLFWNNLSKSGSETFNLSKTLRSDLLPPPPEKLSQRLTKYPGFKNRNPFQSGLKNLGELFIEDLGKTPSEEEEFLKHCYSTSGALSQHALISRQILASRYPSDQQQELQIDRLDAVADKKGQSDHLAKETLAAALTRRPVVIMGDVGVGKTSFLRHLIKIDAKSILSESIVIYVDFGKEPALANNLQRFVAAKCESQLRNDYHIDIEQDNFVRGVYHGDLLRFERGINGPLKSSAPDVYAQREIEFLTTKIADREAHLRASFEHLAKARKRQIVLFLDNIDQRPIEFQEQVFLIAHSMAETWSAATFVSLRPETFHQSRTRGALAAYQPRVFTVAPPRIDNVIIRRFEYALRQLEENGRFDSMHGFSVESESLVRYLTALLDSCKQSEQFMECIDNLSGGNVREALTFVEAFVGSGHVDADKIIRNSTSQATGYTIPVHEFIRAVVFGDYEHYDPGTSAICNVFDISMPDGREHFLLPNLIEFIERQGTNGEGFLDASSVFTFAQDLGFSANQTHFALDRAVNKRLLEPNLKFTANARSIGYRITTVGAYTVKRLVRMFAYVDAMIVDTPIVDDAVRQQMIDVDDVVPRLVRAQKFVKYLDAQWAKFDHSVCAFDWIRESYYLEQELKNIAVRQQGRPLRAKPR